MPISGFSMGIFLTCLVAIGAGAILLEGQQAAQGGVSARVGMLEMERGVLRAQLYDALTVPPAAPLPARLLKVEINPGTANPLSIAGTGIRQVGIFKLSNESDDRIMLRKVTLTVPPNSPMTQVTANIWNAAGVKTQLGSSITVSNSSAARDISFTNSTGILIEPKSSVTLNMAANPSFTVSKTPVFLAFKGAEIFSAPIYAVDGQGVVREVAPPPTPAPSQPTGLTATAGDRQIALSWNATPGATWYVLKRGVGSTNISSEFTIQSGTTYLDQGLTNGTQYYYVLRAANTGGQGQASEWVSATPVTPPASPVASLSASVNQSFGAPSYVAGAVNVRVGSFVLSNPATSTESVGVSSLSFDKDANANFDAQNLKVMVGGAQIGSARAIVANTETSMAFPAASPITVPVGGSVIVDLYADILTSTTQATHASVFDLVGGVAGGQVSNASISFPASSASQVNGQNITIGTSGSLSLANDPDNVPARHLVMGSTDQVLYKMKMTAGSVEDVRVLDITFTDEIADNAPGIVSLQNARIYDEAGALVAGPMNMVLSQTGLGRIQFMLGNSSDLIIPKGSSKTVTVKADVATFVSGAAKSGSKHRIGIVSAADVIAVGRDSNAAISVAGTPSGSQQAVYRTKPSLSSSVIGNTAGRMRLMVDDLASLVWSADPADDLTIQNVTMKFTGGAIPAGTPAFSVSLIDAATNAAWGSTAQAICTPGGGNSCSVSFQPAFSISRGTAKVVKVRVNSGSFANAANTGDSISVAINAASGILWNDGTTGSIGWESAWVPMAIANIAYE